MKSDLSWFVGSGTKTSSGARRVEVEDVVGRADSRVMEATLEIVEIVALGC